MPIHLEATGNEDLQSNNAMASHSGQHWYLPMVDLLERIMDAQQEGGFLFSACKYINNRLELGCYANLWKIKRDLIVTNRGNFSCNLLSFMLKVIFILA